MPIQCYTLCAKFEHSGKSLPDQSSRTAYVDHSFSQINMIKTRLRNRLGETNLSHLMKIAIESPQTLSDKELEQIVDIWNRKARRICLD